jgi:hypothetical protein
MSDAMQITIDYPLHPHPRYGHGKPPHPQLYRIIDHHRERFKANLTSFIDNAEELSEIELVPSADKCLPHWHNDFLPGLDAVAIHGFLATLKPRLVVEIGSGNSTKFFRHAIRRRKLDTRLVSIDPNPRAEVDKLCDEIVRKPLEECSLEVFQQVRAGDVVFFDGSHRVFTNSDAVVFFLEVIPSLPSGVLVQVHDIFLPYDYPPDWSPRYYSEQYLLAVQLLTRGTSTQIELANMFISFDPQLSKVLNPLWEHPRLKQVERHGGSFWFRTA